MMLSMEPDVCIFLFVIGQIAASIAMEIKRMARRKQLHYSQTSTSHTPSKSPPPMSTTPPPHSSSSITDTPADCRPSTSQTSCSSLSPSKRDVPLFTFKQVSLFCERLVKEREEQIRDEYNKILTTKLAG